MEQRVGLEGELNTPVPLGHLILACPESTKS